MIEMRSLFNEHGKGIKRHKRGQGEEMLCLSWPIWVVGLGFKQRLWSDSASGVFRELTPIRLNILVWAHCDHWRRMTEAQQQEPQERLGNQKCYATTAWQDESPESPQTLGPGGHRATAHTLSKFQWFFLPVRHWAATNLAGMTHFYPCQLWTLLRGVKTVTSTLLNAVTGLDCSKNSLMVKVCRTVKRSKKVVKSPWWRRF